jgi:ElaA protein
MLEFTEAQTLSEKATCLEIRRVVFIGGQNVPEERERADENENCRHFLATQNGQAIATLRLTPLGAEAKIERMAVLEEARGQKVGEQFLLYLEEYLIKENTIKTLTLNAQEHAVAFYQKAGFQKQGERFIDANIPHYRMEKSLGSAPE